ncbi:MAG: metallophosphoesterase [Candidatus Pacebacteria bacterium]|nr:metallophosphoesterase [Candidatus Paceibacterota bacterium]
MKLHHKKASSLKSFAKIFIVFTLACFLYSFVEPYLIEEKVTIIQDSDVPDNFVGKKIIFASDFHLDKFSSPERVADIVSRINTIEPDIIILGGDYVTDYEEYLKPCFMELARLEAPLGVYGVTGNHDSVADYRLTVKYMKEAGIIPLENEAQWIEIDGQKIKLGGVKTSYGEISDAETTTDDTEASDFVVLVSHNPDFAEELHTDRIDLMLAGHTHGGQVTFFGLWAPYIPSDYGQKYLKSFQVTNGIPVLVSNGVGTSALPIRFFARPQINIIVLEK